MSRLSSLWLWPSVGARGCRLASARCALSWAPRALQRCRAEMKPAVDEMFPEGAGPYVDLDEAGGSTGLLMDLAANEKAVHADFFNDFEDLFDDDDVQ